MTLISFVPSNWPAMSARPRGGQGRVRASSITGQNWRRCTGEDLFRRAVLSAWRIVDNGQLMPNLVHDVHGGRDGAGAAQREEDGA